MIDKIIFLAIVVITDGVFILDGAYDELLSQCRNSTAVVSFLQIGTGFKRSSVEWVLQCIVLFSSFVVIKDVELLSHTDKC